MKATESMIINGYDLNAEHDRLAFPDVTVGERRLNRGTAKAAAEGTPHGDYADVKAAHRGSIFPNTISEASPVIDYSYPATGMFVDSPAGVYLDLYQGVAQKLIDAHHPAYRKTVQRLTETGLIFRREINTDDFVTLGDGLEGLVTSQDLASLANGLCKSAFPNVGAFRTFFTNSGAESGEAAIKLAQIHAYKRFVARHGMQVLSRVMEDLAIPRVPYFDSQSDEPTWADYPFFVVACESSFHGRTLGVLSLTRSKRNHHLGFGKMRSVRHIPFNGEVSDFTDLIDARPITEILDAPGGVSAVVQSGRIPVDLAALFVVECYQGEGGYRIADRTWLRGVASACAEHGILFGSDEVQSFGRTGTVFAVEHYGVAPDILWTAKGAVVGMMFARAELADDCHVGWHSNTFGGGKFFDVNMSHTTLHLLTQHEEPLFDDRTILENSQIKGEYCRARLADLSARHPELFPDFSGLGGMWGLTVRYREEIVEAGWRMGAKLLGCGPAGEEARLRIVLLADVLTREIDQMAEVLERLFTEIERRHDDL